MFEGYGTAYVYFTYGMHYCLNIVTGKKGQGQAVLIRAIEPVDGIDLMMERRGASHVKNLANGPGKLTQALGINKSVDGTNVLDGPLRLEVGYRPKKINISPRIGISKAKDLPWRFYIADNQFVSHLKPRLA